MQYVWSGVIWRPKFWSSILKALGDSSLEFSMFRSFDGIFDVERQKSGFRVLQIWIFVQFLVVPFMHFRNDFVMQSVILTRYCAYDRTKHRFF